jgi:hypothetical protein
VTRSADEVVTEFCNKWASPDPDVLAGYFTEDAVYHNIRMEPVNGREAIKTRRRSPAPSPSHPSREQTQKRVSDAEFVRFCVCSPKRSGQQGHLVVGFVGEDLEHRAPGG